MKKLEVYLAWGQMKNLNDSSSGPSQTQNFCQLQRACRRARVVKGMDSKPIVISRAGSNPAVDVSFFFVFFHFFFFFFFFPDFFLFFSRLSFSLFLLHIFFASYCLCLNGA